MKGKVHDFHCAKDDEIKCGVKHGMTAYECLYTVESPWLTTSHNRPPAISNHLSKTSKFSQSKRYS